MSPVLMSFALALTSPAEACPTVATGTPQQLTYDVARTAIVHQDGRTTFTVSINPSGEQQEFALVLPVPALLAEDDIAVLDGEIFGRLEGYTGLLTMQDAGCIPSDTASDGGTESEGAGGDVTVEAEYLVGDYEITILSATDSSGLFGWLEANGYHLGETTIPVLEDYIAEGMYFMTAKVSAEATSADGSALPPLQVGYDADVFSIPIRLAARNSPGEQDMLIYAITDAGSTGGRVGVSNYSELVVEDKCIWGDPDSDDFMSFYKDRFNAAWEADGYAGWAVEWAGEAGSCSPCSGVQITDEDLTNLGFSGTLEDHHLTRLHVKYTPATATQDLMLYASGMSEPKVTSFADDNESNRECIELCDASSGPDDENDENDDQGGDNEDWSGSNAPPEETTDEPAEKSGCSVVAGTGGAMLALSGLLVVGRRRA